MAKLTTFLVFAVFATISVFAQKAINRKLILGTWHGNYNTTQVTITFKNDSGLVLYMPEGNHYSFKYSFINNTVIKMTTGKVSHLHQVRNLSANSLHLLPYPYKLQEMIELIDAIDFKKIESQ